MLDVFGSPHHPTTQSFVQTVIHNSVPQSVLNTLKAEPGRRLFRLKFVGCTASEPIINSLIRRFEVNANILFANMTEIQQTTLGTMILQLHGEHTVIDQAAAFIVSQGVDIQEVEV